MSNIIPTIVSNDEQGYRSQMATINSLAKRVQIIVSDGSIVDTATLPMNMLAWPQDWKVDLYLLVSHPNQYLETILKLNPALVILQAECSDDLNPIFQKLKQANIKTGLALSKSTYPGTVSDLIAISDHVLLFATNQNQLDGYADLLQIEKIPIIRNIKHSVEIGWYGGVNMANIREIAHADCNVIYVDKALSMTADYASTYKQLLEEADKRGVKL